MQREKISNVAINKIKLDTNGIAVYIRPSTDAEIILEYSSLEYFHMTRKVEDGTMTISVEMERRKINRGRDSVLRVYIPEKMITQLEIIGSASYVHFVGREDMIQSCNIDVSVAKVYLENIYSDMNVKTITGAIRLKNKEVRSNISVETQVGVIDMSLGQLSDDVSINTKGIIKRNAFSRGRAPEQKRYIINAESLIGVVNIH